MELDAGSIGPQERVINKHGGQKQPGLILLPGIALAKPVLLPLGYDQ